MKNAVFNSKRARVSREPFGADVRSTGFSRKTAMFRLKAVLRTPITVFATLLAMLTILVHGPSPATAQESEAQAKATAPKFGVWTNQQDESGQPFHQMRLRVYPKAAAVPAFKHRLIPAANDRVDGNAALFYLKAMGFFEQHNAREALTKLERKWRDEATEEQRDAGDYPPYTWYDTDPEELPMEQVRQYLKLLSFQPDFLYDAARRTRFEHDRAIEREPNPIGYLLPSIQQHRQLAREQIVRCRFAIAEGRIDDAVEIVGQMMAMGQHLGSDEFLVTCLVGAAVHGMGVESGLVLSQQPETPNLYWAIAACPNPAIDLSRAMAMERNLMFLQLPMLYEVTEAVRPAGFWADFLPRFLEGVNEAWSTYSEMSGERSGHPWHAFHAATVIARDYQTARDFLHEVTGISNQRLDEYPKAQVVFLAIVKFNEFALDEAMKPFVVPFASQPKNEESDLIKYWRSRFKSGKYPPDLTKSLLTLGDSLIPATRQVIIAAARVQQQQNLWQTVEALRLTAAENGGQFPDSLEQLAVPAPLDPATNRPFEYEVHTGIATLHGERIGGYQYQIKLELANHDQPKEKVQ